MNDSWLRRTGAAAIGAKRYPPAAVAVIWLGFLAVFAQPLAEWRPVQPELRAGVEFVVTSPRDTGPGSLREAIFAADRAQTRARIRIRTDRLVLETPLPPLVNPDGVVIEASDWIAEIDARAVGGEPVLDVAAPRSVVRGLRIRGTAASAILVRAPGTRLQNVTLIECTVAVHLARGVRDLSVEDSTFEANSTGIRLEAGVAGVRVINNQFRRHDGAAVWAVSTAAPLPAASATVVLRGNRFEDDRISVVLINTPAEVDNNQFARAREAAIYLTGPGTVRRNRIQRGERVGVFGDAPDGALIEDNEINHNFAVGILLLQARSTEIRRNRVYENGYGIAAVFDRRGGPTVVADNQVLSQREDGLYVVGASPILRGNSALGNRSAGLRVLDYVRRGRGRLAGNPLLQENIFKGNGVDSPVRGEYREPREAG